MERPCICCPSGHAHGWDPRLQPKPHASQGVSGRQQPGLRMEQGRGLTLHPSGPLGWTGQCSPPRTPPESPTVGAWSLEGLGTGTQVPRWGGVRAAGNPTPSPHEGGEPLWALQGQVPRPLPSSFLGAGPVHPMEAKVGSTQTQGQREMAECLVSRLLGPCQLLEPEKGPQPPAQGTSLPLDSSDGQS